MERPVTRGELRAELAALEARLEQKLEEKLEQKFDLKLGVFVRGILAEIHKSEERMIAEMARQTRAMLDESRFELRAVDDQYKDLPARVTRLEREVFPPKRARRR